MRPGQPISSIAGGRAVIFETVHSPSKSQCKMAEQILDELNYNMDLLESSMALVNLTKSDACLLNKVGARLQRLLTVVEENRSMIREFEEHEQRKKALISLAEESRRDMNDVIDTMACHLKSVASQKQKPAAVTPARSGTRSERGHNYVMHLTQEEFNSVPKYMKGNMITLQAVNKFVDSFNAGVVAKYSLLAMPKKELKTAELLTHQEYRRQETPETKGLTFITEKDVVPAMGKKGYDILVILRHCRRIREIRSKGLVRFVVQ